eukprot:TRINITY_DN5304_c0_g1_i3.p1 TRINITY_DN5304_c0_g1~~TRINITY_DN5304_c0_g1_i3.p1  ORF type:complete len:193 (-),score=41.41 TRINITY_DN5304_c0_g1_i3:415-993(-)
MHSDLLLHVSDGTEASHDHAHEAYGDDFHSGVHEAFHDAVHVPVASPHSEFLKTGIATEMLQQGAAPSPSLSDVFLGPASLRPMDLQTSWPALSPPEPSPASAPLQSPEEYDQATRGLQLAVALTTQLATMSLTCGCLGRAAYKKAKKRWEQMEEDQECEEKECESDAAETAEPTSRGVRIEIAETFNTGLQ